MKEKPGEISNLALVLVVIIPVPACSKGVTLNQTLYHEILEHFLPSSLHNTSIDLKNFLCYANGKEKCCSCQSSCIFDKTCCIDVFFTENITSVQEYIHIFHEKYSFRQYAKNMPVTNMKSPFSIQTIPMIATCSNNKSRHFGSCNENYSANNIPVQKGDIIYRNNHCAICHGVKHYSYVMYEVSGCNTTKEEMTIPDRTCHLRIMNRTYNDIKTHTPIHMNCSQREKELCLNSYFALTFNPANVSRIYTNPFCAKCDGVLQINNFNCPSKYQTSLNISDTKKFKMIVSFDKGGKSKLKLVQGKPLCQCANYNDTFSRSCLKINKTMDWPPNLRDREITGSSINVNDTHNYHSNSVNDSYNVDRGYNPSNIKANGLAKSTSITTPPTTPAGVLSTSVGPPVTVFQILIDFNEFGNPGHESGSEIPKCECGYYFDIPSGMCQKSVMSLECPSDNFTTPLSRRTSPSKRPPKTTHSRSIGITSPIFVTQKEPSTLSSASSTRQPLTQQTLPTQPLSTLPITQNWQYEISPEIILMFNCIKRDNGSLIYQTSSSRSDRILNRKFVNPLNKGQIYNIKHVQGELSELIPTKNSTIVFITPIKHIPYTKLYGISCERHFTNKRVCSEPEIISNDFSFTSKCNIKSNSTIYDTNRNATFWIELTNKHIKYGGSFCKKFHLISSCSKGIINMSLTAIKDGAMFRGIKDDEKMFLPEEFIPTPDGIGICFTPPLVKIEKYMWMEEFSTFEKTLSVSLLSLSILLELATLLVHFLLKQLKNIPGKNLAALLGSLLGYDIVVLTLVFFGNISGISCYLISVFLHFLSLSLCTWTGVIAADLLMTFGSQRIVTRSDTLYFRYSLLAWGVPMIVVITCFAVDSLVKNKSIIIGYGVFRQCWISPFYARLIVYIIPFSLVTFGSFFATCVVVYKINEKSKKNDAVTGKKKQLNIAHLTLKLCFVLGASELIGLIQIPNKNVTSETHVAFNAAFGMLYNLVRSSRGIFIFITFIYANKMSRAFTKLLHSRFLRNSAQS